ncbi:MAG: hypothetical protein AB7K64_11150 [Variibacter sp.]
MTKKKRTAETVRLEGSIDRSCFLFTLGWLRGTVVLSTSRHLSDKRHLTIVVPAWRVIFYHAALSGAWRATN